MIPSCPHQEGAHHSWIGRAMSAIRSTAVVSGAPRSAALDPKPSFRAAITPCTAVSVMFVRTKISWSIRSAPIGGQFWWFWDEHYVTPADPPDAVRQYNDLGNLDQLRECCSGPIAT
jgi:hypothetical protein